MVSMQPQVPSTPLLIPEEDSSSDSSLAEEDTSSVSSISLEEEVTFTDSSSISMEEPLSIYSTSLIHNVVPTSSYVEHPALFVDHEDNSSLFWTFILGDTLDTMDTVFL